MTDNADVAEKLRDIQSITDAALSSLAPQAMLDALAERVRHALQADTSAILLLERASGQLVATAASGLEEEVRQGVRITVGSGFAGRIAAEGRPVVLDEVDHTVVVNPILLDKGIRSLMGAPLRTAGSVIGVLHVGTLSPRKFTREDVDLLQLAADRAALAVQALAAHVDRASAAALQRSLLPSALPDIPGLEVAARFAPGSGRIGGDWYDVFVLPSGQVCAVIGDVAGSGLRAAVTMGRLRSALRAYSLETSDPADILRRLEGKIRHFEPDAMATILCAIFSLDLQQVHFSSAGHMPPILAVPGQPAVVVRVPPDPLIGVPHAESRRMTTVDLPPGAVLCLYTDGLVERRDYPIDHGIGQLRDALRAGEPDACCVSVMTSMARSSPHRDDVALLIVRRSASEETLDPSSHLPVPAHELPAPPGMNVRWLGRHAVVTMPDEIDVTNATAIYDALAQVAAQSPAIMTVDLTDTAFCDSGGISALTRAHRLMTEQGGEFRVALGTSLVRRMFQLTGLDQVMTIDDEVRI